MDKTETTNTTRCPHCDMRFQISPQQLEAAHGSVRCGACKQIFDARANLLSAGPAGTRRPSRLDLIATQVGDAPIELPAKARRPRWLTGLLAGACTLLALALLLQLRFWNLPQLRVHPLAGPWLEQACRRIDCPPPAFNDLDQIASEGLVVRTHPQYERALAIDLKLLNRARFSQPWPDLEFVFSDIEGGRIAARRFRAGEYFADGPPAPLMRPGIRARVHLDVLDPGPEASNYFVRFLPASVTGS